jgi:FkbM family methyltransferase
MTVTFRRGRYSADWFGTPIVFNLADYTSRKAYFRSFERRELRFISRTLPDGGVGIDVGANIGLMTLAMAKAVGLGGKVFSFEPMPSNFRSLSSSTSSHQNVTNVNLACSANSLPIRLGRVWNPGSDDADTSGSFSVIHSDDQPIEVGTVRLDSFLEMSNISRIDLLKVDVEGSELNVLLGLGKHLSPASVRTLLIEGVITSEGLREADREVVDLLRSHNYSIFPLSSRGKPISIDISEYRNRKTSFLYWALKFVGAVSINYCAIGNDSAQA